MVATSQEQQILEGQSATLVSYPPTLAQPSACTVRVGTPTTGLPDADSGSAGTVDTVSATVADGGKRGDTSLALTAAAAFVAGRQYVVVDDDTGARLVVESLTTETTDSRKMASPLVMPIAAGSAVLGYAVTAALSDAVVGDQIGRGVAIWSATIGGVITTWAQDIRIVRRQVAYSLTANDVEKLSPYASQLKPVNDDDWRESIQAAWTLYLVPPMLMAGIAPERINSWEVINPWHLAALEYHLAKTTPDPDADIREEKKADLAAIRDQTMKSMRFWVDVEDSESPPADDVAPIPSWSFSEVTR
jgi:hypothetical protein